LTAKYILRLDDACHTMDRRKWQLIEDLCDELGIKPIVAVVPDNRDSDLQYDTSDADFWNRVRSWQLKGWTIAMHGYQHLIHHTKSKLVLPFYQRSEFGGLTFDQQAEKIKQSWKIFATERVLPTVWIAPAHCFDLITLQAIQAETPINIISDGIARDQYYDQGFYWIPQQIWSLSNKQNGLWTVCLHPNTMTEYHIESLRLHLTGKFAGRIIPLSDVKLIQRNKSIADHWENFIFWRRHWKNNLIRKAMKVFRD
jgi:predicted deacetylase